MAVFGVLPDEQPPLEHESSMVFDPRPPAKPYLVKGEVLQRPFLHCPARRLAGQKSCSRQHLSSANSEPSSLKECAVLPEPHHFVPEKLIFGILSIFISSEFGHLGK
jgi:hypothetical protein